MSKNKRHNILIGMGLCLVLTGLLFANFLEAQSGFSNPLGTVKIEEIIQRIILFLSAFGALLALAAIVWGGITVITSFGNESRVAAGKKIIFWGIIGIIIILLAVFMVSFVVNFLTTK